MGRNFGERGKQRGDEELIEEKDEPAAPAQPPANPDGTYTVKEILKHKGPIEDRK
jgi:hypothetical protein